MTDEECEERSEREIESAAYRADADRGPRRRRPGALGRETSKLTAFASCELTVEAFLGSYSSPSNLSCRTSSITVFTSAILNFWSGPYLRRVPTKGSEREGTRPGRAGQSEAPRVEQRGSENARGKSRARAGNGRRA